MRTPIDLRLYVITSGADQSVPAKAAAAAAAGAGVVQVRAKDLTDRALLELVGAVAEAVARANGTTRVVVDDSVAVARAAMLRGCHVHGVHLGQDDLPVPDARRILGPDAVIGLTTGTLDLVRDSSRVADDVDYLGAGPFRLTPTKDSGRPPLGLTGYPPLVAATRLPIVAIGDVTPEDVGDLAGTGVAGVAMVRAVMAAADPGAVVRACLSRWEAQRSS